MRILVVGGTGLIGSAVVAELSQRHEIITAGYQDGDIQLNITDQKSIQKMYQQVGPVDGVVATTGQVHFEALSAMTAEKYAIGLNDKLMGQVNLVLLGLAHVRDGGSFTLTSGILSCDPIVQGSSASMVNAAIEGFVISAAIEMPRMIRINVVSPTVIEEAMEKYAAFFRGFMPVKANIAALAYSKSVEGAQTGKVYQVGH